MMGQTPGWWFVIDDNTVACAPPKCGLMSFMASLVPGLPAVLEITGLRTGEVAIEYCRAAGRGPFSAMDIVANFKEGKRYLSVRDPVERFKSLWKDKCRPELVDDPVFNITAGLSPVELLNLIEHYPYGNAHWMPQWAFLVPNVTLLPVKYFLPYIGLKPVHVHHFEDPKEEVEFPVERTLNLYSRDVDMWNEAKSIVPC